MNNTKNLPRKICPSRKSSIQTLYDIQIKAQKKKIDSYKKVFLIKKNAEKEKNEKNCLKKDQNNKSSSTTPYIDYSLSLIHESENNSVKDKINQGKNYSDLHLKFKTILQNMEEYDKKIKAKVKRNINVIKSRNPTENLRFHFNSIESSIHATQSLNYVEEQFDQLFLNSTEPTFSHCNQTIDENSVNKNNQSIKCSETIEVNPDEFESNYIENLTNNHINIINNLTYNNNNKLKMNSRSSVSFNSTSTKNLRNSVTTKYEQDLEEKEKFKQAVLNKKLTKSTTNLLIKKPKMSALKTYGIVSKTVAARKSVTILSKAPDNKVSQRESLIIPLSESIIDKAERSHGVITLDLNDTDTKHQENQTNENIDDSERLEEEEAYACELSNIYEDPVEKDEHAEEKVQAAKNDLIKNEKSVEVIEQNNSASSESVEEVQPLQIEETNARNSVIINIQNSFNDLMINRVNDITLTYENHNTTAIKDKNNFDDSNIVDSQINFSINHKKEKSFLISSQNGFDIITPKVFNIYHNENSNKSPRGNVSKVQNFEKFIEEEVEIEKSLNYSNDINMVNEINENIINNMAQRKKSFEEDRIKTVDNFLNREKANETVNIKEIEYEDGLDNELLCPNNEPVNNQLGNDFNEILLKNKKFSQLLEMIDRPASENQRYEKKNILTKLDTKINKKNENIGEFFSKSKNEENSKSLLYNIELTRKIISQNDKTTNQNTIDKHSLKKGNVFIQPNESVNLNALNDYYNSYNQGNTKAVNTVIYRKPIENNVKHQKVEFDNKFFNDRIATNFANKYIKSETNNKSITNSSQNKINKYFDFYNDNSGRKNNISINLSKIDNNDLKSSCNNLKISQSRHIETLKTIFEKNSDKNQHKGKLPVIDICLSHKKESYSKRNQTEERMFNIMPSNDIDLKQIRMNKSNMMHLINIK